MMTPLSKLLHEIRLRKCKSMFDMASDLQIDDTRYLAKLEDKGWNYDLIGSVPCDYVQRISKIYGECEIKVKEAALRTQGEVHFSFDDEDIFDDDNFIYKNLVIDFAICLEYFSENQKRELFFTMKKIRSENLGK